MAVTTSSSAQMISDRIPSTTGSLAGFTGASRRQYRLAQRVEWAGTDIAVDDADAAEREGPESNLGRRIARLMSRDPAALAVAMLWDIVIWPEIAAVQKTVGRGL